MKLATFIGALATAVIVSCLMPRSAPAQHRIKVSARRLPRNYGSVHRRAAVRKHSTRTTTTRARKTVGGQQRAAARSVHVSKLPSGAQRVNLKGRRYYRAAGRYYYPYYYGDGVYYREVDPPEGADDHMRQTAGHVSPEERLDELVQQREQKEEPDGKTGDAALPEDAMEVLQRMQAFLKKQTAVRINFREERAEPQADGTFKTAKRLRSIAVRRPNRLRAAGHEGDTTRRFYYDGSSATVYDVENNAYSVVPFNGPNTDLLDHMRNTYGVTVPLADFLREDTLDNLKSLVTRHQYMGREKVEGKPCDALLLLTKDAECRLWIQASEQMPVLRKVAIMYSKEPGTPTYSATVVDWIKPEKGFDDVFFSFTPPVNADLIDILPVEEDTGTDDADTTKP